MADFFDRLLGRGGTGGGTGRGMARIPVGAEVGSASTRELGSDYRDPLHAAYPGAPAGVEPNPELAGPERYRVYDEMRLSDGTVRALLWHMKLPILRALWDVDPAGTDPVNETIAEFVRWNLGLGERPGRPPLRGAFPALLRQSLLCIDYGSMTSEIVWGPLTDWVDSDGVVHRVRPVAKVAPRYPGSIMEYRDPPAGSREYLGGIVQWGAQNTVIPGEKLIHHVIEPENDPYRGTSVIRPCWGPWTLKKNLLLSSAIAYDRYSAGVPVVRYPTGSGRDAKTRARNIAQGVRTNERAWVTFEGGPDEGWSLEIVSGAGSIADPLPLLRHYDLQIMAAGLAKFAELGTTTTGSRAVAEVLAGPFYMALESFADLIASDLTSQLIARIVEVNFGAEYPVPTLRASKITAKDLEAMGRYVTSLASAGIPVTDEPTVRHLRSIGGLPEPSAQGETGDGPPRVAGGLPLGGSKEVE